MAEKKTIELEIKDNVGSLKSQLRQAQAEVAAMSEKFGETSREAANAAKKAAELKDRIGEAKALTDAFDPDAKFNSLSTSIGGVLNGFQAYEGALGLIGVESESLQKTMLKVQSAMALSDGINGVLQAKDNFIKLGAVVKNAFAGMTQGAKLFAVTGIGLLVTAIGLVVANWDSVSKAIGLSTKEQDEFIAKQKRIAEEQKKQNDFISKESSAFATLIARLKTTNEGSKERRDLIKEINSQYGTTLKNLSDEKKFQNQLNAELKNYLEYQRQKYILQANEEKIQLNLKKQAELNKKIAEQQARLNEIETIIEKRRAKGSTTDEQEFRFNQQIKSQQARIELTKKELENAEKRFESYGRSASSASAKLDDLSNSGQKFVDTNKAVVQSIEEVSDAEKYIVSQMVGDNEAQRALDRENEKRWLEEIPNTKAELNKRNLQVLIDARTKELEIEKETADKKRQIDEETQARKERNQKFAIESTLNGLQLIASITELFGKKNEKQARQAFAVQKAVNIASALISTYTSAQQAYQSQFMPIPDPSSPIRGAVAAGLAIAGGLANVAKISSQQFNGGGASGSSSFSGSSGGNFMPSFNVVGNSGVNQLAQLQQQPVKAYITSGDVSSAMSLERNKLQKTTF